jgi:hypothetical protein
MLTVNAASGFGSGGGAAATDEYFDNVVILYHFDGADGATSGAGFADSSGNSHTATARINAAIDTAQSKFGGSSLLLDGSSYTTAADSADFDLGAGDWTIECWARWNTDSGTQAFCGQWSGARSFIFDYFGATNKIGILYSDGSNKTVAQTNTWSPTLNTWYNIAFCRVSNVAYFFVDGVRQGTDVAMTQTIATSDDAFVVGSYDYNSGSPDQTSNYFDGWIEDLRFTVGVGRYTASYDVPTAPYPDK